MRFRRHSPIVDAVAVQQAGIVEALLAERADLVWTGQAPPLPEGLLAMIEGGWVTMTRATGPAR